MINTLMIYFLIDYIGKKFTKLVTALNMYNTNSTTSYKQILILKRIYYANKSYAFSYLLC